MQREKSIMIGEPGVDLLDRKSFVPLYHQIQKRIMDSIENGELAVGDRVPPEEDLSRVYHVSRMTARQALQGLKASGYVSSQKGRGTFVTRPKLEKSVLHLRGFTQEMRHRGMKPSSVVLAQTPMKPDEILAEKLHVAKDEEVFYLRRLRLADGNPMALEDTYIPLQRFPGLERIDFGKQSLYSAIRERYDVKVAYAQEVIEAINAGPLESELLAIPKRACVLSITRMLMTAGDVPVEYSCSHYRADRYRAILNIPITPIE